jgi:hypothetical protein
MAWPVAVAQPVTEWLAVTCLAMHCFNLGRSVHVDSFHVTHAHADDPASKSSSYLLHVVHRVLRHGSGSRGRTARAFLRGALQLAVCRIALHCKVPG